VRRSRRPSASVWSLIGQRLAQGLRPALRWHTLSLRLRVSYQKVGRISNKHRKKLAREPFKNHGRMADAGGERTGNEPVRATFHAQRFPIAFIQTNSYRACRPEGRP
jgi:hypothetical protein